MDFGLSPIVLTLGVVIAALVCFVGEWWPADLTALMVAVALIVLGVVTPEEGISGFGNAATITVLAMFILSAGITRTGAVQIARDLFLRWGGKTLRRQLLALGLIVGPITAFINNTAVVAIFLPIIEDWCQKRNISPSKLLLPLSYVTILGGMITVIGTSTNVLASGISQQLGYGEFGLFQFTLLGLLTFAIGMAFLVLFG
ncbi:MAG: SLC13 family permease, partial [Gloeomargaritaceae cyanobacterium C42_A2020_066]|nr:SLC13 family permease [Gloeomargaritaceae cyanobacterium C42_A2020_066]